MLTSQGDNQSDVKIFWLENHKNDLLKYFRNAAQQGDCIDNTSRLIYYLQIYKIMGEQHSE